MRRLRELYRNLVKQKLAKWKRCLPFAEMIVDRREKALLLGFAHGTTVYDSSYIYGDVKVGSHTWIGPLTILDGTGGLVIGDYCSISAGVHIYTHDTVKWAITGGKVPYEYASVTIGDRCYIGPNVIITKGVHIGAGSLIGAASLVTHDIPENSKAWGTPCRIMGQTSKYQEEGKHLYGNNE